MHQTTKITPLRQIWSNKSFGICDSDVLTLFGGEKKKVRENRHWKLDVVYNTTSLPRRRDDTHSVCATTLDVLIASESGLPSGVLIGAKGLT